MWRRRWGLRGGWGGGGAAMLLLRDFSASSAIWRYGKQILELGYNSWREFSLNTRVTLLLMLFNSSSGLIIKRKIFISLFIRSLTLLLSIYSFVHSLCLLFPHWTRNRDKIWFTLLVGLLWNWPLFPFVAFQVNLPKTSTFCPTRIQNK